MIWLHQARIQAMPKVLKDRRLPSVAELASALVPVLAETKAQAAYLCGPYVRADKHDDIRREDELDLLIFADVEDADTEQSRCFSSVRDIARKHNVYPAIRVIPMSVLKHYETVEDAAKAASPDYAKIYDISIC